MRCFIINRRKWESPISRISILAMMMFSFFIMKGENESFKDGDFVFKILSPNEKTVCLSKYEEPKENSFCNCCSGCKGCSECTNPEEDGIVNFPSTAQYEGETYTVIEIERRMWGTYYLPKGKNSIRIPDTVIKIGEEAFFQIVGFEGERALETIYIPATTTSIAYNAFSCCAFLTNIIIDEDNPNYSSQGTMFLDKSGKHLYSWPSAKGTAEVPYGIESIGPQAFYYMLQFPLNCLILPSSVTKIDDCAFECTTLDELWCYSETPPFLGRFVFLNYYTREEVYPKVYVPNASVESYKADASWKRLADYIFPMNPEDETRNNSVSSITGTEDTESEIYSIDGRFIMRTSDPSRIKELTPGIYVINGEKIAVSK